MSAAATQPVRQATVTLEHRSLPNSPPAYDPSQASQTFYNALSHASPPQPTNASRSPGRSTRSGPSNAASSSPAHPSTSRTAYLSSPEGSNATTPRPQAAPLAGEDVPTSTSDRHHHSTTARVRPNPNHAAEAPHGPPIPPPPRTSSHQPPAPTHYTSSAHPAQSSNLDAGIAQNSAAYQSSSSRPSTRDARQQMDQESAAAVSPRFQERSQGDTTTAAAAAARSRRKGPYSPHTGEDGRTEHSQHIPSTSQGAAPRDRPEPTSPQTNAAHVRMDRQTIEPSNAAVEASSRRADDPVIDRVVITDPAVDIERERARQAEARPLPSTAAAAGVTPVTGLGLVGSEGVDDGGRGGGARSRHDHAASSSRKETRFGEYVLGRTLGEGEFGKVKMGWKPEGGVQVAIKLIRRESLGTNPSRLPKINREITILRELSHPNIVRLHEMVETDRYIGIILEYASGGELFDYILNHRYLKDPAARRLFAQLVSGVGYLHKKGIVHRDLKLENLLLDRNKNIIITDFGFANTFDPNDELGDELEYRLSDKDFVKRMDLGRVRENGFRRGDLMQTSCGSPCYAAPELVVSDSLYTGRKVDVWSCGVILYAMLAGYLPFDDDPANPEGDNINLLYKYIVSTPLTFPDYVTPHARDLLRRILVADPRKRADLFEVARHSWLSEYAHVVSFITSSTTTTGEISNTTVTADHHPDAPLLARSASVREPAKPHQPHLAATTAGVTPPLGHVEHGAQPSPSRIPRDAKRRTVQVEYVAPASETARGEAASPAERVDTTTSGTNGERAVNHADIASTTPPIPTAYRPRAHTTAVAAAAAATAGPQQGSPARNRAQQAGAMAPPSRPVREPPRSVSDSSGALAMGSHIPRPNTGGSLTSTASRSGSTRLPSRGSYSRPGQPSAPAVATTNAQGRLAQPNNGKAYVISNPMPTSDEAAQSAYTREPGRSGASQGASSAAPVAPAAPAANPHSSRAHKRANTVGGFSEKIFGRSSAIFTGRSQPQTGPPPTGYRPSKAYPPTSMPTGSKAAASSRVSTDSRRSVSYGYGRTDSNAPEKPKRFSFLPTSFSFKHLSGSGGGGASSAPSAKEHRPPATAHSMTEPRDFGAPATRRSKPPRPVMAFGRGASQSTVDGLMDGAVPDSHSRSNKAALRGKPAAAAAASSASSTRRQQQQQQQNHPKAHLDPGVHTPNTSSEATQRSMLTPAGTASGSASETSFRGGGSGNDSGAITAPAPPPSAYPPDYDVIEDEVLGDGPGWRQDSAALQKPARRFADAYEPAAESRYARTGGHSSGSSGAARKVMDFFRRRGKARTWDDH